MKKITQVSIVYMFAALVFAQPVAYGFSLNQFTAVFNESIKPYITFENCIKTTILGSSVALVGYALWKLRDNGNYKARTPEEIYNDFQRKIGK